MTRTGGKGNFFGLMLQTRGLMLPKLMIRCSLCFLSLKIEHYPGVKPRSVWYEYSACLDHAFPFSVVLARSSGQFVPLRFGFTFVPFPFLDHHDSRFLQGYFRLSQIHLLSLLPILLLSHIFFRILVAHNLIFSYPEAFK